MTVLLLSLACTGPGDTGPRVEVEPPMAVVATLDRDYATGALALVSLLGLHRFDRDARDERYVGRNQRQHTGADK